MTDEAMSPLRRRMIEDMAIRKLARKTQQDYIQTIKKLAAFLGRSPDTATFEDLRRFQLHVVASGVGTAAINRHVSALRFFFRVTLKRYAIVEHTHFIHEPRKLPVVLSQQGGGAAARCRAGAQVQGGAERGLWRGPARRRNRLTQGLRHRQQADDHARGAGQRPQRPQRHAVTASARALARVVEGDATTRLAISGPRSGAADDDTSAQSRLPRRGSARRDR